jgi:septum formation protein
MDKAGAYDISGFGSVLVEKIKGCFYNVAGLPIFKFINMLEKFNYKIL